MISPTQARRLLEHYGWVHVDAQVWCCTTTGGVLTLPSELHDAADEGRMYRVMLHLADSAGCSVTELEHVAQKISQRPATARRTG